MISSMANKGQHNDRLPYLLQAVPVEAVAGKSGNNTPNMAINFAPSGRWTLRRGAAHRQLFLR
jgi:hypothetical protein